RGLFRFRSTLPLPRPPVRRARSLTTRAPRSAPPGATSGARYPCPPPFQAGETPEKQRPAGFFRFIGIHA
ncbi:hypothetical protein JY409_10950, partial [Stenotrophomonas maltophilia]|nr:hypothetical protein [Stenotrophomonas maltophilia]